MADLKQQTVEGIILIVEDNLPFGELLAGTLSEEGYCCHTVSTGAKGLAWLAINSPVLLLLDYTLSDMSGESFVAAMQSQGCVAPFIIVTGRDDSSLAVQMIKQGASDFLVKDTTLLDRLPVVVARTLQESSVMQRLQRAELALRQSELRLSRAQRIARIASWELDLQANRFLPSAELMQMLGYELDTTAVLTPDWLYHQIHLADALFVRKTVAATIESGRSLEMAFRIATRTGEELSVTLSGRTGARC